METEIQNLGKEILEISKSRGYNIKKISDAINFLKQFYKKASSTDEILHALRVTSKILTFDLGTIAVIASLLHDIIDEENINFEQLYINFGKRTIDFTIKVSKLNDYVTHSDENTSDLPILQKFVITTSRDVRILIILLAERLDILQEKTLHKSLSSQIAKETIRVHAPLADYIGLQNWKRDLEDVSFSIIFPDTYNFLKNSVYRDTESLQRLLNRLINEIKYFLKDSEITNFDIYGRVKSPYSLYKKFVSYLPLGTSFSNHFAEMDFSIVRDVLAIRILVEDVNDCYKVLEFLEKNYKNHTSLFDDYIKKPKRNGYRSIHLIVNYLGRDFEIQIRTQKMHEYNEFGPASHLAYKLKERKNSDHQWLKEIMKWSDQQYSKKSRFRYDLFNEKVFTLTPKGKVIELAKGSTPLDFAFAVHTDLGTHFISAKVNGLMKSINYRLKTGDIVEIITSKQIQITTIEWLKFTRNNNTKTKIRKAIKIKKISPH